MLNSIQFLEVFFLPGESLYLFISALYAYMSPFKMVLLLIP